MHHVMLINPHYFETVDNCLQDRVGNSDYQILVGDFNTTLDYNRDRLNYSKTNDSHKQCRELINNWFEQEKWVDIYDYKHPGKKVTHGSLKQLLVRRAGLTTVYSVPTL